MLSIIGLISITLTILLILVVRISPISVFILVPVVAALVGGFAVQDIGVFVGEGIGQVSEVATLFIFAILYFGIMNDSGLFDPLIKRMINISGTNVIAVAFSTALIAMVSHLDGSGATTFLITIPALLPLYKRLNMSPYLLLLIVGASAGVMNLVPWGGPLARAATSMGVDPTDLWRPLIPVQIIGIILVFLMAIYLGLREKKRIMKHSGSNYLIASTVEENKEKMNVPQPENDPEKEALTRPKLIWFNLLLTIIVVAVLMSGILPSSVVFMIALSIALPVNYSNSKEQVNRIRAHAPAALQMAAILLAAGAFLGVMNGTGMIESIATDLVPLLPGMLGPHLDILMAIIGLPLVMIFTADQLYFSLMPIVQQIAAYYDIGDTSIAYAMLLGENLGFAVSPVVPSVYLAIGLAGLDLAKHIRYSILWLWGISLILFIISVMFGLIG